MRTKEEILIKSNFLLAFIFSIMWLIALWNTWNILKNNNWNSLFSLNNFPRSKEGRGVKIFPLKFTFFLHSSLLFLILILMMMIHKNGAALNAPGSFSPMRERIFELVNKFTIKLIILQRHSHFFSSLFFFQRFSFVFFLFFYSSLFFTSFVQVLWIYFFFFLTIKAFPEALYGWKSGHFVAQFDKIKLFLFYV